MAYAVYERQAYPIPYIIASDIRKYESLLVSNVAVLFRLNNVNPSFHPIFKGFFLKEGTKFGALTNNRQ